MGYVLADQIAERVLDLKHAQKAALVQIARHGDNDGRNMRPSALRLALGLECSERQAERMFVELREAGWLVDDGWLGRGRWPVLNRRIPVERLAVCPLVEDEFRARGGNDRQRVGPTDNVSVLTDSLSESTDSVSVDTAKTRSRHSDLTARSETAHAVSTARVRDDDIPSDWACPDRYWSTGWRRDLARLCRKEGLVGPRAQLNAASIEAITWSFKRGYGLAAIRSALRNVGRDVDGRPCTVPWALHATKIDAAIADNFEDTDWYDVDPFDE